MSDSRKEIYIWRQMNEWIETNELWSDADLCPSLRLVMRGCELSAYMYVWDRFRLVELPWDSAWTWWFTFLGVDFCYYWVHRFAHGTRTHTAHTAQKQGCGWISFTGIFSHNSCFAGGSFAAHLCFLPCGWLANTSSDVIVNAACSEEAVFTEALTLNHSSGKRRPLSGLKEKEVAVVSLDSWCLNRFRLSGFELWPLEKKVLKYHLEPFQTMAAG